MHFVCGHDNMFLGNAHTLSHTNTHAHIIQKKNIIFDIHSTDANNNSNG